MTTARRTSRLAALVIAATVLLMTAALTAATPPNADAQAVGDTAQTTSGCRHLKQKAHRARRGSARRRKYVRAYERCRRNAAASAPTTDSSSTSGGPAPDAAPAPAPQTQAPAALPNPDGYVPGQGCLRSWEARFNAAGFTCQFSGQYQRVYLYPTGWVTNPIYILFRLCPDGSGRIC